MASRWQGETHAFGEILAGWDVHPFAQGPYVLVDGLFGIGRQRPLELGGHNGLFSRARRLIAIDLPSGIDGDSGEVVWQPLHGTRRVVTVALGALKPVHVLAADRCGDVLLDDLDLDPGETGGAGDGPGWRSIARPLVRAPSAGDHKYRRQVTIIAGAMAGAARLAARAASSAGAGYVVLLGDGPGTGPLDAIVHRPEGDLAAVLADDRGDNVVVVGPGLGRDDRARQVLDAALDSTRNLVLDGDALTLLGEAAASRLRARQGGRTVLTPHEGEFARMFGGGQGTKLQRTANAARATGATIVHKGYVTVIAGPSGVGRVSVGGSTWLATAGTGDVLAGAVAARFGDEASAVWLHSRAASLAGPAFAADRLADLLPGAISECLSTHH
jgi:hydroxyethylthiazole kinase-like uncharacterized protein yjeF